MSEVCKRDGLQGSTSVIGDEIQVKIIGDERIFDFLVQVMKKYIELEPEQ